MQQGFDLMLFGMGTVVIFLAILVVSTQLMSWVIQRYFTESEVAEAPARVAEADQGPLDPRLLAVIKAAVDQHRIKRR